MDKNFKKIKTRHILSALLKGLVCGISAGLSVVGIALLTLKLCAIDFSPLYYALIGVGVALVVTLVLFLVFFPSDKRIAKKIDDDYALSERVQTALEYGDKKGTIVAMQRADAGERLQSLRARGIRISEIWQYALALILAAAIAVAGFLVPLKHAAGEEDPYSRPPTEFEMLALEELKKNVEDSSLSDTYKTPVVGSLESLIEKLRPALTVSEVMEDILSTIDFIDTTLSEVNSYGIFADLLEEANFNDFAEALTAASVYREYRLITYDLVQSFEKELISLLNLRVETPVFRYRETYKNLESTMAIPLFTFASETIESVLTRSGVSPENGLYIVLNSFKSTADAFIQSTNEGTMIESYFQHQVDLAFYKFTDDLIDGLKVQSYTLGMDKFVVYRIKTIFNLPIEEEEESGGAGNKEELPGSDDDPDDNRGGGYGEGETKYGSDDEIYDPNTGKYVKYGELLSAYYAIVLEYMTSGSLTEEQSNMASYYFEILFSGFQTES